MPDRTSGFIKTTYLMHYLKRISKMPVCKICTTLPPKSQSLSYQAALAENPANVSRQGISLLGVALDGKVWKAFRTLSVTFLDNLTNEEQTQYREVIREWGNHINLDIVFTSERDADIRIKTKTSDNSSAVGTDALTVDVQNPTMYIAEKPGSSRFRTVLLHEFGHALGFEHEHLHPYANIPWNKQKVYDHFTRLGMSRAAIDENFFTKINQKMSVTAYDPKSIMHYPIEKTFTDGVFEVTENTELSRLDIHMARTVYPR
jgi:predicted Zn-dependent protease